MPVSFQNLVEKDEYHILATVITIFESTPDLCP